MLDSNSGMRETTSRSSTLSFSFAAMIEAACDGKSELPMGIAFTSDELNQFFAEADTMVIEGLGKPAMVSESQTDLMLGFYATARSLQEHFPGKQISFQVAWHSMGNSQEYNLDKSVLDKLSSEQPVTSAKAFYRRVRELTGIDGVDGEVRMKCVCSDHNVLTPPAPAFLGNN